MTPGEVLKNQINFKSDLGKTKKRNPKSKSDDPMSVMEDVQNFLNLREKAINLLKFFKDYPILLFEAKYKAKHGKGVKILTTKQIFQRLPIALAQVKAGNTSENLLNKVRQIIYSLYQTKEISKNVYNNIMNSIKLENRMGTIFTNSGNNQTSDPHRLLLNLAVKINFKGSDKKCLIRIVKR